MVQTTADRHAARRRAATSLAASALVTDVARKLAPSGISVMPVKGALLQYWLYDDPTERPLTDVDLLVLPEDLEPAVKQLESAGYRSLGRPSFGPVVLGSGLSESTRAPRSGISLRGRSSLVPNGSRLPSKSFCAQSS